MILVIAWALSSVIFVTGQDSGRSYILGFHWVLIFCWGCNIEKLRVWYVKWVGSIVLNAEECVLW